jgi:integrase
MLAPRVIADAGDQAARRFLEFFAATIRNKNTRMAYYHAVTGQVVATNPAHAVRGPKHVVKTGKTTVLTGEQARELLDSIDTSTLAGLRDRALISVMTFAFARIGAVIAMRVEDYYPKGKRWWVRLHEKGGKRHEMPAHHNLEAYLDAYIEAAGIRDGGKAPLFRSAAGRTGALTATAMNRVDAWRMIQRRAAKLGTRARIGCHTFRATGITAYLEAGGTLENAQAWPRMKAHGRRSSTTARGMRSRSMRSSGLRFDASKTAIDSATMLATSLRRPGSTMELRLHVTA